MIKIPISVGDTVLGGRFKNKKIVVKKIGKNAKGDVTINGKPLLKFRIFKESFNESVIKLFEGFITDLRSETEAIGRSYRSKMDVEIKAHVHNRIQEIISNFQGLIDEYELVSTPKTSVNFLQFDFSNTVLVDRKLLQELLRVNKKLSSYGLHMYIGKKAGDLFSLTMIEQRYKTKKGYLSADYIVFKEN
jgi:hypothetical protein